MIQGVDAADPATAEIPGELTDYADLDLDALQGERIGRLDADRPSRPPRSTTRPRRCSPPR